MTVRNNEEIRNKILDIYFEVKDRSPDDVILDMCKDLSEELKGVPIGLVVLEAIKAIRSEVTDELEEAVKRGDELYDQLETMTKKHERAVDLLSDLLEGGDCNE